jgi:hypothetical protein
LSQTTRVTRIRPNNCVFQARIFAPSQSPDKGGSTESPLSTADSRARTISIADAHRGDGQRFIVRADEKLTAFLELEAAIHACGLESELGKPLKETEQAEAARKRFLNSYQASSDTFFRFNNLLSRSVL